MLDWYIKKFNPFTVEDTEILGERGRLIRLPLTAFDARERPEFFRELTVRTLYTLRDYGVGIVLSPPSATDFPDILPIADGRVTFAFFMPQAIESTLKLAGKSNKTAEILLIDGDRALTMSVLDNIYPHINYLTLVSNDDYAMKCAQIYDDCGLNVRVSAHSRSALENADIVINTREESRFDNYYKRGAVYFELSRRNSAELAARRGDILLADGLRLINAGESLSLERFECGLHSLSRDYRRLKSRYDSRLIRPVAERIRTLGYSICGLTLGGSPVKP